MRGSVIFRYQLLTAWGSLICETVVRVTNTGAVISNFADGKKKRLFVGIDVVERIQKIVSTHEAVFAYNDLEHPAMLDGVQQRFVFSTENRKKKFVAWNIEKYIALMLFSTIQEHWKRWIGQKKLWKW